MIPTEIIPGIELGERGREQKGMMKGVNSSMIYCKNFCGCHNVPPHSTPIKKKKKRRSPSSILYKKKSIQIRIVPDS
jgi:hypothetical protein